MASVTSSEIQKNFGEWHDRSFVEPVEITKYGRSTAFLISATLFKAMWESYRQSLPVADLQESDVALILGAEVETDRPYTLDDIPDSQS